MAESFAAALFALHTLLPQPHNT